MGDLISLSERRREPRAGAPGRPARCGGRAAFSFDLLLPGTYLAAERVDRGFAEVRWQPVSAEAFWGGRPLAAPAARAALVRHAEDRAAALGLPLVWPQPFPSDVRPAMRVALLAAGLGRAAAFVLAAGRLAYCGGFDLGDPEVLAEAAAAASIPLEDCLLAAGDPGRDLALAHAGRRVLAQGATDLPAVRIGRQVFSGEERLAEALATAQAAEAGRLLPPASA